MTNEPPDSNNFDAVSIIDVNQNEEQPGHQPGLHRNILRIFFAFLIFTAGFGSGYLVWGRSPLQTNVKSANLTPTQIPDMSAMIQQINPPDGFAIPVKYGDIGPKMLAAKAFDLNEFVALFQQNGEPLSTKEVEIISKGSQDRLVISSQNAHFLLNFFWALGLVNQNPILENGPIQKYAKGKIDQFASTGGWTLGRKPVSELFSSARILQLSPEQQARVEEVAKAVYRPCCDNPTDFPDCNHGMAMLGLLELMASQDARVDEMFTTAKQVNAFWFPQQTLEQAIYFKYAQNQDYSTVDARSIVSARYSSSTGFRQTHQWLANNGLLEQAPNSGNSCGV
jgi:hypothetical protein